VGTDEVAGLEVPLKNEEQSIRLVKDL